MCVCVSAAKFLRSKVFRIVFCDIFRLMLCALNEYCHEQCHTKQRQSFPSFGALKNY